LYEDIAGVGIAVHESPVVGGSEQAGDGFDQG
jgi:hypothetical protein